MMPARRGPIRTMAQFPETSTINPALKLFGAHLPSVGVQAVRHGILPGDPDRFPGWLHEHGPRLDVVHLHWYQRLYLRSTVDATELALERVVEALREVRRHGTVITWTAHNLSPHEQPFAHLDAVAADSVAGLADRAFVECPEAMGDLAARHPTLVERCVVVPSGSYAPLYPQRVGHQQARRLLGLPDRGNVFLAFGLIRRYKQVPELVTTFRRVFSGSEHVLLVAGEPHDAAELVRVLEAADDHDNIVLRLERVPESMVPTVMAAANHVVCNYADSFNSGVSLLAASLGRGVVMPRLGTAKGMPDAALVPIGAGVEGLSRALSAATEHDWRAQGRVARSWAAGRTWPSTAAAARAAWDDAIAERRAQQWSATASSWDSRKRSTASTRHRTAGWMFD